MHYKWSFIVVLIFSLNLPLVTWAILLPSEMYAQANESAENKDYVTAFAYYKQAALRGHIESQRSIASMYLLGKGVKQNSKEGIHWLTSAAEHEDIAAQFMLVLIYRIGLYGIAIDSNKSKFWQFKVAAANPILALWCGIL